MTISLQLAESWNWSSLLVFFLFSFSFFYYFLMLVCWHFYRNCRDFTNWQTHFFSVSFSRLNLFTFWHSCFRLVWFPRWKDIFRFRRYNFNRLEEAFIWFCSISLLNSFIFSATQNHDIYEHGRGRRLPPPPKRFPSWLNQPGPGVDQQTYVVSSCDSDPLRPSGYHVWVGFHWSARPTYSVYLQSQLFVCSIG